MLLFLLFFLVTNVSISTCCCFRKKDIDQSQKNSNGKIPIFLNTDDYNYKINNDVENIESNIKIVVTADKVYCESLDFKCVDDPKIISLVLSNNFLN